MMTICKMFIISVFATLMCLLMPPAQAVIDYNDGSSYVIDTAVNNDVRLDYLTAGAGTNLDITAGGSVNTLLMYEDSTALLDTAGAGGIECRQNSEVDIQISLIDDGITAYNHSIVNFKSGTVSQSGTGINTYDSSQITITGGFVDSGLNAYHNSSVTVSEGSISFVGVHDTAQAYISDDAEMSSLTANGSSSVTISNGSIGTLVVADTSQATITGGSLSGQIRAGSNSGSHSSLINLAGMLNGGLLSFTINGNAVSPGELASTYAQPMGMGDILTGMISGQLANGDSINTQFFLFDDSDIMLIPEPASLCFLMIGGFSLKLRNKS